jgi:hypothetical protein
MKARAMDGSLTLSGLRCFYVYDSLYLNIKCHSSISISDQFVDRTCLLLWLSSLDSGSGERNQNVRRNVSGT